MADPWISYEYFFLMVIYLMLQKNEFGQKKLRISRRGSNVFWSKALFWSIMKMAIRKNIHNLSQGPPNPGFMQKKVQKGDFLKKPLRELNFLFCFRFLWISGRPGMLNCERVFFWLSKNLYKQCVSPRPKYRTEV